MRRPITAAVTCLSLAACAGKKPPALDAGPPPGPPVAVAAIVNAIKCELAGTFARNPTFAEFVKPKIEGTIELENVVARGTTGSAGLEVVPLGITIGPRGEYSRTRTDTDTVTLAFHFDRPATVTIPAFCADPTRVVPVKGDPFDALLTGLRREYDRIERGEPKVQLGKISYSAKFEIERAATGGAELSFVIFKLGAERSVTRTASQAVTLDFEIDLLPALSPMAPTGAAPLNR